MNFEGEQATKKESETAAAGTEAAVKSETGGEVEGFASKEKEGEAGEGTEKAVSTQVSQGLFSTWNSVIGASFFFLSSFFLLLLLLQLKRVN